jgi:branched-chain amino acid transport system permease protein
VELFLQQLINGVTLGSIYGLIAIGYTMVFGIIGMVNFAHGDVFMLSTFIALIVFLALTQIAGVTSMAFIFVVVLIFAMAFTALWNWLIERLAYRRLRGSFRLAPLISAIGMSIFLANLVYVVQGPRNKSIPPQFSQSIRLTSGGAYDVTLAYKQILIVVVTIVLLAAFWFLVQILIYVMLGWGLNIVVGLAGLLDLGYVAFYAVGAYSYALLATDISACRSGSACRWPASWPPSGASCSAFPVLRLRGDYLAIVTLAFGEIIRLVLINWRGDRRAERHLRHPAPDLLRPAVQAGENGFAAMFGSNSRRSTARSSCSTHPALALLTNWVTMRLRRLPIGRAWEALREDEIACRSLGINTTNTKLTAFAIGAMFGGFAGSFFATRQGFISPEASPSSNRRSSSPSSCSAAWARSSASPSPPPSSAVELIGGFRSCSASSTRQYRMLVFGLAMVLMMVWKPRGLSDPRADRLPEGKPQGRLIRPRQGGPRLMTPSNPPRRRGRASDDALRRPVAVNDLSFTPGAATSPRSSARTAPARPRCSTASPASTSRPPA